ncbi:MAG: chromosome segregation protein SMC, partial [Pusillimonas sp.]
MRLTQIKLAGFKSFVEPTVIPTPSQLVGVVGPNGCGKSNIIDAVRWVLGETRASELRGESMQDVIFNGSGQRKPAARASVELVFDNAEGRAVGQWSVYSEIAVRRVLTRDGTSSYFVNNQHVRRRDIHDIFLGTGLGARGYAIIGQGMINRLIEARPEELRVYLEEAAGVSRYKERRRETENRLADTRENLTRLDDILRELDSQLLRLEAQAEVASRYRALQSEGEQKQQALWLLKEENARSDQKSRFLAIEQAQTELEAATAGLRRLEADLEARRQAHYQAGDRVHAAQGRLYEAGALVSRLETEIRHVVDSRTRVQTRRAQLQSQQLEWQEQGTHCADQIARTQEDIEIIKGQSEVLFEQLEQGNERLPDIDARVRAASASRDEMRTVLSRVEQSLALVAQTRRDADRQVEALQQRRERLEHELRELNAPEPAEIERLAGELEVLQGQLDEAHGQVQSLEEQQPELEAQRQRTRAQAQQESATVARLEARQAALVKLQNDVQTQGALQPWLEKHDLTALARLWQHVHIQAGWESALEAVLRECLAGLEVRHIEHARAFVQDPPPVRLAFYQRPEPAPVAAPPPGFQPMTALLKGSDPELRTVLDSWLSGVFWVDDLAQALARRHELPAGAVFVVREGHLVDAHSVRFYAPDSEQSGLLARQQEIDHLQREIKAGQLIADEATGAVARAESAWQTVAQAVGPARTRVAELTRRAHDVQLTLSRLQQQAEQSGQRAGRIHQEVAEIEAQTVVLNNTREESEARFETLDLELADIQNRYEEAQMSGERLSAQAEQARSVVRELERRLQEQQFSERSAQSRLSDLQRNFQLAQEQARRAADELESLQGELFELDASAAQAGLQEALEQRAMCEADLAQARIALDNLAASLREIDEQRLANERSLDPLRARITELQLQEQAARLTVEQYSEQLDTRQVSRDALRQFLAGQPESWQRVGW